MPYKIKLDLEKVNLYGWQGNVSKPKVDSIIKGIKLRDNIPPVNVYKIDDHTYQLTQRLKTDSEGNELGQTDGGHTRSMAHLLAKAELECIVLKEMPKVDLGEFYPILINDLILRNDKKTREDFKILKQKDPAYR